MKQSAIAPPRRLVDDREGSTYIGLSRSQFRELVASRTIPRVVVPSDDGRPLRRLLVDVRDLDRLIECWKQKA